MNTDESCDRADLTELLLLLALQTTTSAIESDDNHSDRAVVEHDNAASITRRHALSQTIENGLF